MSQLVKFSIYAAIIFFTVFKSVSTQSKIVCFWNPMSSNRNGKGIFTIKNIDPHLCTHLVYAYFIVDTDGTIRQPQFGNVDEVFIYNFVNLRRINPHVKMIAGIGGPDFPTDIFLKIANDSKVRVAFANKVYQFLTDFNFDGVNFYWPFPKAIEKRDFVIFLEEVVKILRQNGKSLSISVTPNENNALNAYDLQKIGKLVDFISLDIARLHDINGLLNVAVPHAPLHPSSWSDQLNMEAIISNWKNDIFPNNNLVIGIPTYGRSYTLSKSINFQVGDTVTGNGNRGDYGAENVRKTSILPFNEICFNLKNTPGWVEFSDNTTGSPYAFYNGNQWISYDNVKSVNEKVQFAIIEQRLGGAAFYDIDMDDFANDCGFGNFPLITAAFNKIFTDFDSHPPDVSETEFTCLGRPNGNYQNSRNCGTFFTCANSYKYLMNCPGSLYYHEDPDMCLHMVPEGCTII